MMEALGHAIVGQFWARNPFSRRYRMTDWDHAGGREVDWVSGSCFLARREAWDAVGGFDSSYFMYLEDVDLCRRLHENGWSIAYEPAAQVTHIQGVSADRHPYRMLFAHHVSMWRFAERTTTGWRRWLLPLVMVGLAVRLGVTMARRALAPKLAARSAVSVPEPPAAPGRMAGPHDPVTWEAVMGKASSSKKVARAAGLGGSRAYGPPAYAYYFGLVVLVVLGLVGIYNATQYRDAKVNAVGNTAPTVGQTPPWYQGYAVEACGKLLAYVPTNKDPYGITTKEPGIITISPTVKSAAGQNATLGKFASSIGITLNAAQLQLPGGKLYQDGQTCEGKPGHVYVMTWTSPQEPASDGVLQTSKSSTNTCIPDCNQGALLRNDQLVTMAFLPAPPKEQTLSVLQPPASVISKLTTLVAAAASETTTSSSSGTASTTTTVAPTTTTAKK